MAKKRLLITIDQEYMDVLNELSKNIKKPSSTITRRLLEQHYEELKRFNEWISKQKPGSVKYRAGMAAYENKTIHRNLIDDIEIIERDEE